MNRPPLKPLSKQAGLSLVELMIAATISLILLAGVGTIFANSKQTYRVQEAVSRLQENGRFAMGVLTNDIRMADFWGCVSPDTRVENNIISTDPSVPVPEVAPDGSIIGTDNAGLNGSDAITMQGLTSTGYSIIDHSPGSASFVLNTEDHDFHDNDIVFVTNCENASYFIFTGVAPGNDGATANQGGNPTKLENATKPLGSYSSGNIYRSHSYSYSIQAGASGEPALFRNEDGTDLELIEGVENMQIIYGEDTDDDGTANVYRIASDVTDMNKVVSIRVTLTLRTLDDNIALKKDDTHDDRRIRRDFTSTITIRNRVS